MHQMEWQALQASVSGAVAGAAADGNASRRDRDSGMLGAGNQLYPSTSIWAKPNLGSLQQLQQGPKQVTTAGVSRTFHRTAAPGLHGTLPTQFAQPLPHIELWDEKPVRPLQFPASHLGRPQPLRLAQQLQEHQHQQQQLPLPLSPPLSFALDRQPRVVYPQQQQQLQERHLRQHEMLLQHQHHQQQRQLLQQQPGSGHHYHQQQQQQHQHQLHPEQQPPPPLLFKPPQETFEQQYDHSEVLPAPTSPSSLLLPAAAAAAAAAAQYVMDTDSPYNADVGASMEASTVPAGVQGMGAFLAGDSHACLSDRRQPLTPISSSLLPPPPSMPPDQLDLHQPQWNQAPDHSLRLTFDPLMHQPHPAPQQQQQPPPQQQHYRQQQQQQLLLQQLLLQCQSSLLEGLQDCGQQERQQQPWQLQPQQRYSEAPQQEGPHPGNTCYPVALGAAQLLSGANCFPAPIPGPGEIRTTCTAGGILRHPGAAPPWARRPRSSFLSAASHERTRCEPATTAATPGPEGTTAVIITATTTTTAHKNELRSQSAIVRQRRRGAAGSSSWGRALLPYLTSDLILSDSPHSAKPQQQQQQQQGQQPPKKPATKRARVLREGQLSLIVFGYDEKIVWARRVGGFMRAMRGVLGDRSLRCRWGGSVLDSVVGTFLTQNAADVLSSAAFMNLAAAFPGPRSRSFFAANRAAATPSLPTAAPTSAVATTSQAAYDTPAPANTSIPLLAAAPTAAASCSTEARYDDTAAATAAAAAAVASPAPLPYGFWIPEGEDIVDWEAVRTAPEEDLAELIRCRGMHLMLAKRIQAFLNAVHRESATGATAAAGGAATAGGAGTAGTATSHTDSAAAPAPAAATPRSSRKQKGGRAAGHVGSSGSGQRDSGISAAGAPGSPPPPAAAAAAPAAPAAPPPPLASAASAPQALSLEWLRGASAEEANSYLLGVGGLGRKSVACITLLALHRKEFPVDINVARVFARLGWIPIEAEATLEQLDAYPQEPEVHKYLHGRLMCFDQETLYELHYQAITLGKVFCQKRLPNCDACPLAEQCDYARQGGQRLKVKRVMVVPQRANASPAVHTQRKPAVHGVPSPTAAAAASAPAPLTPLATAVAAPTAVPSRQRATAPPATLNSFVGLTEGKQQPPVADPASNVPSDEITPPIRVQQQQQQQQQWEGQQQLQQKHQQPKQEWEPLQEGQEQEQEQEQRRLEVEGLIAGLRRHQSPIPGCTDDTLSSPLRSPPPSPSRPVALHVGQQQGLASFGVSVAADGAVRKESGEAPAVADCGTAAAAIGDVFKTSGAGRLAATLLQPVAAVLGPKKVTVCSNTSVAAAAEGHEAGFGEAAAGSVGKVVAADAADAAAGTASLPFDAVEEGGGAAADVSSSRTTLPHTARMPCCRTRRAAAIQASAGIAAVYASIHPYRRMRPGPMGQSSSLPHSEPHHTAPAGLHDDPRVSDDVAMQKGRDDAKGVSTSPRRQLPFRAGRARFGSDDDGSGSWEADDRADGGRQAVAPKPASRQQQQQQQRRQRRRLQQDEERQEGHMGEQRPQPKELDHEQQQQQQRRKRQKCSTVPLHGDSGSGDGVERGSTASAMAAHDGAAAMAAAAAEASLTKKEEAVAAAGGSGNSCGVCQHTGCVHGGGGGASKQGGRSGRPSPSPSRLWEVEPPPLPSLPHVPVLPSPVVAPADVVQPAPLQPATPEKPDLSSVRGLRGGARAAVETGKQANASAVAVSTTAVEPLAAAAVQQVATSAAAAGAVTAAVPLTGFAAWSNREAPTESDPRDALPVVVSEPGWEHVERILSVVQCGTMAGPAAGGEAAGAAAGAAAGLAGSAAAAASSTGSWEPLSLRAACSVLQMDAPATLADGASVVRQRYLELSVAVHPDKCRHPRAADAFAALTRAAAIARRAAAAGAAGAAAAAAAAGAAPSPAYTSYAADDGSGSGCGSGLTADAAADVASLYCIDPDGTIRIPAEAKRPPQQPPPRHPLPAAGSTVCSAETAQQLFTGQDNPLSATVFAAGSATGTAGVAVADGIAASGLGPEAMSGQFMVVQQSVGTGSSRRSANVIGGGGGQSQLVAFEPGGRAVANKTRRRVTGIEVSHAAMRRIAPELMACWGSSAAAADAPLQQQQQQQDDDEEAPYLLVLLAPTTQAPSSHGTPPTRRPDGGAPPPPPSYPRGRISDAASTPVPYSLAATSPAAGGAPQGLLRETHRPVTNNDGGDGSGSGSGGCGLAAPLEVNGDGRAEAAGGQHQPFRQGAVTAAFARKPAGPQAAAAAFWRVASPHEQLFPAVHRLQQLRATQQALQQQHQQQQEGQQAGALHTHSSGDGNGDSIECQQACPTAAVAAVKAVTVAAAEVEVLLSLELHAAVLMPCRTALRGGFPLNGTFFQTNEYFLLENTGWHPLRLRLGQLLLLGQANAPPHPSSYSPPPPPLRASPSAGQKHAGDEGVMEGFPGGVFRDVFFGHATSSITRDMAAAEVAALFNCGAVCVRAFCCFTGYPRPLPQFLAPTSTSNGAEVGRGGGAGGGNRRSTAKAVDKE
ncbi:hypothetical protein Agub_g13869 [Astrephomene gubernaculifera]|uniref:Demeter RRM-fold domain-containing protein n=1 Tax=Astrephomene gubernaculifera TaxID=47775 RepID=A0AAD3E0I6_9CHLO|nr:hypothetical protein Agub_g13869 [Astrephomene gubernaculifera]